MRWQAAFALLLSVAPAAAADWEGVFEGTLGKSKIIVQLVEPQDDMEGDTGRETSRYSYLPKTRDLNLYLKFSGKNLGFEESVLRPSEFFDEGAKDRKISGRWLLRVKGNSAKGKWSSADGKKTLPVTLTRVPEISREEAGPDRNIPIATYDELWGKSLRFTDAGAARTFGPVEIRWVKDSAFGIGFPMLGAFPDKTRKGKANATLLTDNHRSVVQYRECLNGVPNGWEPENPEAEFGYEINYASATLLSVTESGSVFCGGAHPSNYVTPITYDLVTGERMGGTYLLDLSPEGFGRVLKLANKDERIAFERFALGRWKAAAAADPAMADCATGWIESSPEGERAFSLSLTEKGLAVTRTDFPHAASNCLSTGFNPTIVPWTELKPWLKDGQVLLATEISP
jgi:hypothetical protein